MAEDRDTPITAAGDTNLRSIGAEADSQGGLVAAPVQDVRTSAVLAQCEGSPRLMTHGTPARDNSVARPCDTPA
jgi:hypothetical protein